MQKKKRSEIKINNINLSEIRIINIGRIERHQICLEHFFFFNSLGKGIVIFN